MGVNIQIGTNTKLGQSNLSVHLVVATFPMLTSMESFTEHRLSVLRLRLVLLLFIEVVRELLQTQRTEILVTTERKNRCRVITKQYLQVDQDLNRAPGRYDDATPQGQRARRGQAECEDAHTK